MPQIHIVSKTNNADHTIVDIVDDQPSVLPASSIRVRNKAITLSANNLSYARGGDRLRWWDAYQQLISNAPEPYNSPEAWGVVPAWGQAEVLESNIDGLVAGDLLFGLLPTASTNHILRLTPGESAGVWKEHSKERSKLMEFYNTYRKDQASPPPGVDAEAFLGLRVVAECPWLLREYVFSPDPDRRLHPSGIDEPWTEIDADLSQTVLMSLSAAGKTARAFAWYFQQSYAKNMPLAMVQVTTNAQNLRPVTDARPFPVLNIDYDSISTDRVFDWIQKFQPVRVVICDFGAKDHVLHTAYNKLRSMNLDISVLGIGSEAKVYTTDEQKRAMETFQAVAKRQVNTGALRSAAILRQDNAATYFEELDSAMRKMVAEEGLGKLAVDRREGLDGVRGAWKDLCDGKASAMTYINVYF